MDGWLDIYLRIRILSQTGVCESLSSKTDTTTHTYMTDAVICCHLRNLDQSSEGEGNILQRLYPWETAIRPPTGLLVPTDLTSTYSAYTRQTQTSMPYRDSNSNSKKKLKLATSKPKATTPKKSVGSAIFGA